MKKLYFILFISIALDLCAQNNIEKFKDEIELNNIKKHVYTLCSKEMGGRETGTYGQKMAANYISGYFRNNGLDSLNNNAYKQPFNLFRFQNGLAELYTLNKGEKNFVYTTFLNNQNVTINNSFKVEYVGFGNNIQKKDLSKSVVLILIEKNLELTLKRIEEIRKDNGAKIFIALFKNYGHNIQLINRNNYFDFIYPFWEIKHMNTEKKFNKENIRAYRKIDKTENKYIKDFSVFIPEPYYTRYFFNCNSDELFENENNKQKGKHCQNFEMKQDSVYLNMNAYAFGKEKLVSENIISYIEGTTQKDEVIVVSAHYDGKGKLNDDIILYGADDDASGTAAIMELANAFQKAYNSGLKPKRSIMFVAFDAEEAMLLGSKYFIKNPPLNKKDIVLNVNFDMIGRNDNNDSTFNKSVYCLTNSLKYSKKLYSNSNVRDLEIIKPRFVKKLLYRNFGDHKTFRKEGIPYIYYGTGIHPDYHRTSDTPDKLNYEKLTNITKHAFDVIWQSAN
jgi:hypothetical protein